MENLHDKRKVYEKSQLIESEIKQNPIEQFRDWFMEASENPNISEANAMALSTLENDGCPRTRMVLLKAYTYEGFIFYTNYDSRKGKSIEKTHKACLHFFWPNLERQIIIKAEMERIAENLSDGYFHSRPKGSQLGAVVSPQSEEIPNREFLEDKLQQLEEKYADTEIPRPENWGGYIAKPYEIEFWQGRPNRLHDRIVYELVDGLDWKIARLAP
ncbi:pyridoxamine 5'-phosphate oxidase [Chryseobacterium gambrini]|jgi:pyridoxamine 5'-phosphate oxidase|uniref:Pyridoxine/pyridoxamine 5'-phosphate oxidase n=1 Tax=Chryseobacterium gambrini TaxID=373672 RepID=A0AAJ1R9M0_9FLAO|nr:MULTISPECIES: pyridoxamine 5'-phosphate oxidase [Chryseobacterium]MDN4014018.1 pyridoxamine 5'-phosphate oxidase [Chryseobacterium gambrini]MDN4031354.1 pyridoxamine 5'-phosphate oxidase [Chryseobacterium gambrini]QWA40320.1 pyridoxamine 5'-phosphate oxidase [Chryseobacterium sp. ZHDP1]